MQCRQNGIGAVDVGLRELAAVFGPFGSRGKEHVNDGLYFAADIEWDAVGGVIGRKIQAGIDGAADGRAIGSESAREILPKAGASGGV